MADGLVIAAPSSGSGKTVITLGLLAALRRRGINTSSPLREDAVIDMDEKRATSALRISPHYYNTPDEIDRAIAALAEVLEAMGPRPRA